MSLPFFTLDAAEYAAPGTLLASRYAVTCGNSEPEQVNIINLFAQWDLLKNYFRDVFKGCLKGVSETKNPNGVCLTESFTPALVTKNC